MVMVLPIAMALIVGALRGAFPGKPKDQDSNDEGESTNSGVRNGDVGCA